MTMPKIKGRTKTTQALYQARFGAACWDDVKLEVSEVDVSEVENGEVGAEAGAGVAEVGVKNRV
jgi:hypothetical protein